MIIPAIIIIILFSALDVIEFCIFDNETLDWFKNQFDNIRPTNETEQD